MLEKLPASLGRALHGRRAGLEKIVLNRLLALDSVPSFEVRSSAFGNEEAIPAVYTADGRGLSPPLSWRGIPPGIESMVLIVEDPDAPSPEPLVHAIVVDIAATVSGLDEGAISHHEGKPLHIGRNSYLKRAWLPPDPPPGHGTHRYVFQLFALGAGATFSEAPGRKELIDKLIDRAIAAGQLVGTYKRPA